jgi:hypothetical protein
MPVVAVAVAAWQVTVAVEVGFAALTAFQTLAVVGSVTSAVGAVTGNKDLSKAGMIMGAVGGIGNLASSQGWLGEEALANSQAYNNALFGKPVSGSVTPSNSVIPTSSQIVPSGSEFLPEVTADATGVINNVPATDVASQAATEAAKTNVAAIPAGGGGGGDVVNTAAGGSNVTSQATTSSIEATDSATKLGATSVETQNGVSVALKDGKVVGEFNKLTGVYDSVAPISAKGFANIVNTATADANLALGKSMSIPGVTSPDGTGYWDSFKAFSKANPTIAYAGLTTIGTTMAGLFDQTKAAQKQQLEAQAALTAQQVANINRPIGTATPGAPRGPVSLLNSPVTGRVA